MEQEFFSKHGINDEVGFYPTSRQRQEIGIAHEKLEGKIMAVKFTEAKVSYDVYSPYWGEIFKGVTSERIFSVPENTEKV